MPSTAHFILERNKHSGTLLAPFCALFFLPTQVPLLSGSRPQNRTLWTFMFFVVAPVIRLILQSDLPSLLAHSNSWNEFVCYMRSSMYQGGCQCAPAFCCKKKCDFSFSGHEPLVDLESERNLLLVFLPFNGWKAPRSAKMQHHLRIILLIFEGRLLLESYL